MVGDQPRCANTDLSAGDEDRPVKSKVDRSQRQLYEIRVGCHLSELWSEWFEGLTVANLDNGEAVLSGYLADQAALHGVLSKLRDLNLPLISVRLTENEA